MDPAGNLFRSLIKVPVVYSYLTEWRGQDPGLLVPVGEAVKEFISIDPDVSGGFAQYSAVYDRAVFPIASPGDCSDPKCVAKVQRHVQCLHAYVKGCRLDFNIPNFEGIKTFIARAKENGWLTYDFETTGTKLFKGAEILGFSLWTPGTVAIYVPILRNPAVDAAWPDLLLESAEKNQMDMFVTATDAFEPYWPGTQELDLLCDSIFMDPSIRKVAHNAYFDALCAWRTFGTYPVNGGTCTMLGRHVMDSTELYHPIDEFISFVPEAAGYYFDVDRIRKLTKSYSRIPTKIQAGYCCGDSIVTGKAVQLMLPHVNERKVRHLFELQADLVDIYAKASIRGIKVDLKYLAGLKDRFRDEAATSTRMMQEKYGVSATSPKQVMGYLSSVKTLIGEALPDLGLKSDDESLKMILDVFSEQDSLSDEEERVQQFIQNVRECRGINKLYSTYIVGLEKHIVDGRVHPIADIGGARSGRMSYSDPNIQNQPVRSEVGRLIRGIFIPDNGCLFENDASKAEMVIAAWLSGDEKFIKYLTEYDIYRRVGEEVTKKSVSNKQRNTLWKPVVLANLYLASPKRLQRSVNLEVEDIKDRITLRQAEYLQQQLERLFPDFAAWKKNQVRNIEKSGQVVNCFGRVRRGEARYLFNTLIQGTCSDLIQFAIRNFCKIYGKDLCDSNFVFNLHDAIYVDAPVTAGNAIRDACKSAYDEEAVPRGLTFMKLDTKGYVERWGQ